VVALQALAAYAVLTSGDDNLNIDISIAVDDFSHQFDTITSDNSILLQSVQVCTILAFAACLFGLEFLFFSLSASKGHWNG
jgi:hypothetical protein